MGRAQTAPCAWSTAVVITPTGDVQLTARDRDGNDTVIVLCPTDATSTGVALQAFSRAALPDEDRRERTLRELRCERDALDATIAELTPLVEGATA